MSDPIVPLLLAAFVIGVFGKAAIDLMIDLWFDD